MGTGSVARGYVVVVEKVVAIVCLFVGWLKQGKEVGRCWVKEGHSSCSVIGSVAAVEDRRSSSSVTSKLQPVRLLVDSAILGLDAITITNH